MADVNSAHPAGASGGFPGGLLPDFDLAPPRDFSPETVLSSAGNNADEAFFLALALVYNDLKGMALMHAWLRGHQPKTTEPSAYRGQWAGLNIQIARYSAGIAWELVRLIQDSGKVLEGSFFKGILASIPRDCRASWKTLVELAHGAPKPSDEMANALVRVRNNATFHYYNPKPLVAGFRHKFFGAGRHAGTERAYASVGVNMEGTRFYFADAAAEGLVAQQAAGAGVPAFGKRMEEVVKAINFALVALVSKYLLVRNGEKPRRPPIAKHGSGIRKKKPRRK